MTGSIINPRIFIRVPCWPPGYSVLPRTAASSPCTSSPIKLFGALRVMLHLNVFSQKILARRRKIYQRLLVVLPGPLIARGVMRVHEHFKRRADELFVARDLNLALAFLQDGEPAALFFLGNRVRHRQRGRIRARRILEREDAVVSYRIEQRKRLLEIRFRLAREADDHVGGKAELAARALDPAQSSRDTLRACRCGALRAGSRVEPDCTGR